MTGVVVWPYPIRVVAERLPEEDRPGFIALRWVRPNPVRRVLAQMRYPLPDTEGSTDGLHWAAVVLWWGEGEGGRLETLLGAELDNCGVRFPLGSVIRLASDRKYPYDPAKEAEDLLATLITGTGAVPVADRLLASLDKEP